MWKTDEIAFTFKKHSLIVEKLSESTDWPDTFLNDDIIKVQSCTGCQATRWVCKASPFEFLECEALFYWNAMNGFDECFHSFDWGFGINSVAQVADVVLGSELGDHCAYFCCEVLLVGK